MPRMWAITPFQEVAVKALFTYSFLNHPQDFEPGERCIFPPFGGIHPAWIQGMTDFLEGTLSVLFRPLVV